MKKKVLCLALVFCLVISALVACGGTPPASASDPAPAPASQAEPDATDPESEAAGLSGSLTVSTHQGEEYLASWTHIFDQFNAETGVSVEMDAIPWPNMREKQALELASESGAYDVLRVHPFWYAELVSNGYLIPIDDYASAEERAQFDPNLLELYDYEGQVYGLPDTISTIILAYRKDLFEEANLPAPESWEDVLNAAATLHKGEDLYGITFPGSNSGALAGVFLTNLLANDAWLFDDSGKPAANSQAAVETAEYLAQLSQYAPLGYQAFHWDESDTLAGAGQAAMIFTMSMNSRWLEGTYSDATAGLWGYVPITNLNPGGFVDSYCWAVAANSQNPEAAKELVKYLASTESQVYLSTPLGTAGATKAYYEDADFLSTLPWLAALGEAFTGRIGAQPAWSTWSAEQEVLQVELQKLFNGETTAQAAMDAFQDKMMEAA